MDSIHQVSAGAIEDLGFEPGSMNLITAEQQGAIAAVGTPLRVTAGGSCANTLRGAACLASRFGADLRCIYSGAVGHDTQGGQFESILHRSGVESHLRKKPAAATGTSTILVSPDGQRTMFTQLEACRLFQPGDVDHTAIASADILYFTGFMWDTPNQEEALRQAMQTAQAHDVQIVIDIADIFVADRYRDKLMEVVPQYAAYVLCNEQELASLLGQRDVDRGTLLQLARQIPVSWLVKVGSEGCFLVNADGIRQVPGVPTRVVDTTGAGDAFAAGFLFYRLAGAGEIEALQGANALASAIVAIEGCVYEDIPAATARLFPTPGAGQSAE
ncbi:adenosine kinase [Spirochaeta africana]|nr:adenosine kinase [Spirochaeta africana]